MTARKKKKATVLELALGSGLLTLFLPVIIFGLGGALLGITVGAVYTYTYSGL